MVGIYCVGHAIVAPFLTRSSEILYVTGQILLRPIGLEG